MGHFTSRFIGIYIQLQYIRSNIKHTMLRTRKTVPQIIHVLLLAMPCPSTAWPVYTASDNATKHEQYT